MGLADVWTRIGHVVLDWNGTILDDVDLAVRSVNELCRRRGLAAVDRDRYRAAFRFPIEEFYRALGFDFAAVPFAAVMREYLDLFDPAACDCPLQPGAADFLQRVRESGRGASVLSASHQPTLDRAVRAKGLGGRFDHVRGLGDEAAAGKHAEARRLQAVLRADPAAVLYVGDTEHDAAVAEGVGWHAAVLTCGHQDAARVGPHAVGGFAELWRELFGG